DVFSFFDSSGNGRQYVVLSCLQVKIFIMADLFFALERRVPAFAAGANACMMRFSRSGTGFNCPCLTVGGVIERNVSHEPAAYID
ncbi:hypothetical protein, partial [Akkermansia sp.]|uniref:hypothetical protein n=2 Tax=Akkermansia sp. TaxID=1872421 RepID=UPI003AF006C4